MGKVNGAASPNRAEDSLPLTGKTTKSFGAKELNPHLEATVKTNPNLNRNMETWGFWKNTLGVNAVLARNNGSVSDIGRFQ